MKFIRNILFFICATFCCIGASVAAISSECEKYTDCDMLVACELTLQIENAIAGLATDYEGAVANAANYLTACANYPDSFKNNIDAVIHENPQIKLTINWDNVRKRMRNGEQANFDGSDLELVNLIVDFLGPDTQAQKLFFTALATAYVNADKNDPSVLLDDAFVLDFLGQGDNLNKYKSALITLTGESFSEELGIDVSWDEILIAISEIMDQTNPKRGAIVCENNRSIQVGIDIVGWIATAAAAIATFYAGGAGGAGVAAGKAAIGQGLKAAAKGLTKVGVKGVSKKLSKEGGRQLAKAAMKMGLKANMRGFANYAGKGVLKTGIKTFVKEAGKNLAKKWTKIAVANAVIYQLGKGAAKATGGGKLNSALSTIYSLVSSDLDKTLLNCQDLDHNEGCYSVCGDGFEDDYLNRYVFKPMFGKSYCVNPDDYALHEINPDGSRGKLLIFDASKQEQIISTIKSKVYDKSDSMKFGCDWNEDDIDMYFGSFIYDPDTLEISDEGMMILDATRLDD